MVITSQTSADATPTSKTAAGSCHVGQVSGVSTESQDQNHKTHNCRLTATFDDLPEEVIVRCIGALLNPVEACHLSMCNNRLSGLFPSPLVIRIANYSNGSYLNTLFFVSRVKGSTVAATDVDNHTTSPAPSNS